MGKNIKREKFEICLKQISETDSLILVFKQRKDKQRLGDVPVFEQIEVRERVSNLLINKKIKVNVGTDIKYSLKGSFTPKLGDDIFWERSFKLIQPNLPAHKRKAQRKLIGQLNESMLTISTQDSKLSSYGSC